MKTNVSQNLFEPIKQPKISENLAYLPSLQPPVKVEDKSQSPKP
ncbi:MAG: hypothetical protein QNJ51_24960 [Calothrix sp. MO_167.B12]|nr:hypothetical protein [Calothrix sp. MO_167.B12]